MACEGSKPLGMGFILLPEEAEALSWHNPKNTDVLRPYLNGQDLNSHPKQEPSRWIISFFDWPLDRRSAGRGYSGPVASDYPDCLSILEMKVKPERQRTKPNGQSVLRSPLPERWWQHAEKRTALYDALSNIERALVVTRHSKHLAFAFIPTAIIASEATVVIADPRYSTFATLQSSFHDAWVKEYQSSLGTRGRYTPSDCLDTFPFPKQELDKLRCIGERYYGLRASILEEHHQGLTDLYNRFHSPEESAPDIHTLRDLHIEMDKAVSTAYGWSDLDLGHGFHETKQGTRFTIIESARREVLARLLTLNHERYADEVAHGLHDKAKGKPKPGPSDRARKSKGVSGTASLFGDDDD